MTISFIAMPTEECRDLQAGGVDANGQRPERAVAPDAYPCRHCLGLIGKGAPFLILAYRPFPTPQPYAEVGPIFIHAEACNRGGGTAEIPAFLTAPRYMVRGYNAENRIIYGSGRIVDTRDIPVMAEAMLRDAAIAYLHVRSASNNCYHCRIERTGSSITKAS